MGPFPLKKAAETLRPSPDLNMRYVAAYLLAAMGGQDPTEESIKSILGSVGIEADAGKLGIVISNLKGKSLADVVAEGQELLATIPSGGAVAAGSASAAPAGGDAGAAEEKKEDKAAAKEESESDDDMGFGLFD